MLPEHAEDFNRGKRPAQKRQRTKPKSVTPPAEWVGATNSVVRNEVRDKKMYEVQDAITAKLAEIAAKSPTPPAWYERLSRLRRRSSTERLLVFKKILHPDGLLEDVRIFMIAWQVQVCILCSKTYLSQLYELEKQIQKERVEFNSGPQLRIEAWHRLCAEARGLRAAGNVGVIYE